MSDLINRVNCPMGCSNSSLTQTVKVINEGTNPLLLEVGQSNKTVIKMYTCNCCGNSFEMKESSNPSGKFIL